MPSVVAPTMFWVHLFRKLSSRSSLATSIFLMCVLVTLAFILFTATVVFQNRNNDAGGSNFFALSFNILHSGTVQNFNNETHFVFSRILARFYEDKEDGKVIEENPFSEIRQNTLIYIAVVSAFANAHERNAIRATWGHPLTQMSENVMIRFFMGRSQNSSATAFYFNNETSRFDDEIELSIDDDYSRLASKSKLVLQWLANDPVASKANFHMKVDDDTYINLPLLATHFRNVKLEGKILDNRPLFFCHLHVNSTPVRDNESAWYVDMAVFNQTKFPNYCSGSAYVFSSSATSKLASETVTMLSEIEHAQKGPEIPEDVLITGLVPLRMDIGHVDMAPFFECCFHANSSSTVSHNGLLKPEFAPEAKPNLVEWLCRRATEGAMVLHPLKQAATGPAPNIMGALLVASLTGSYHDCLNLASSSSSNGNVQPEDDTLGSILTIREAAEIGFA